MNGEFLGLGVGKNKRMSQRHGNSKRRGLDGHENSKISTFTFPWELGIGIEKKSSVELWEFGIWEKKSSRFPSMEIGDWTWRSKIFEIIMTNGGFGNLEIKKF